MKNYIIVVLLILTGVAYAQTNQAVGINTELPKATLDVNGDVIVRNVPVQTSGSFFSIGINDKNQVVTKSADVTSYAIYLGFDPKAPKQSEVLPIKLENGYITKITGTTIGACYGVMVDFTIVYLGTRYLGATLKAINTLPGVVKDYPPVVLDSTKPVFGTALEVLAKASECSPLIGHFLTYDTTKNEISVRFNDTTVYYKDAGTFVIYNIDKIRQHD